MITAYLTTTPDFGFHSINFFGWSMYLNEDGSSGGGGGGD